MLYPLKFKPLYKERIWGGRELETTFGKKLPSGKVIGESWELSAVAGDVSVVSNGKLKGNNLQELIEIYMGDLVGENVYDRFGDEFPLLIKLIDAQDFLSIQVHPNDELSRQRHNAYGKTEMWYVIDHKPGAELFLGFNQEMTREKYIDYLNLGKLDELLTRYKVSKNSAYFIPAGAIHAIGKGILIAEIQQTSDITYRVFDFNRVDANG
ncbi:MAG: type I phosphomannose isomerase catalytic subunit, partial [Mucinivorans sp.]